MKEILSEIIRNTKIAKNTYMMYLTQDGDAFQREGQFCDVRLPDLFLRRPFSIAYHDDHSFGFVYKTVGKGSTELSQKKKGEKLSILLPLGNGFDTSISGNKPLLLGGGSGCGMIVSLAIHLKKEGKQPFVLLGFNTKEEVFFEDVLDKNNIPYEICVRDGSYGQKGFVTERMNRDYSYFYTCGPEAMLKAVSLQSKTSGQLSLERRMGCGFGSCMGCSIMTANGPRRVCKEGPIFKKEEIVW